MPVALEVVSDVCLHVQARVKISAVKEKITLHCSGGPEDHISKEAVAAEVKDGKQLDRIGLGLSCGWDAALGLVPAHSQTRSTSLSCYTTRQIIARLAM